MTVTDEHRAALVALTGLPGIGPRRLQALVGERSPAAAWQAIRNGTLRADDRLAAACGRESVGALIADWRAAAGTVDPAAALRANRADGSQVLVAGDAAWPSAFDADPDPPAVLYVRGEPAVLAHRPCVAIVGTRRATRYGLDVARRFGAELAGAGVTVVSGLAAGIDGAAHHGVLDVEGAPPVGVVGSGLDVVYPRGHRQLWERVATAGCVCSETPRRGAPTRWRFPARNRIIAALAAAVVVVESPAIGGSMHTVEEAARRDRPVLAVPGPITSRASSGTNRLLAEGAIPACDPGDVLVAIGLGGSSTPPATASSPTGPAGAVLDALAWQPVTLDQLVLRTGLPLATVARLALELEGEGWLATDGGWYERRR